MANTRFTRRTARGLLTLAPFLLAACVYGPGWHHGGAGYMPGDPGAEYASSGEPRFAGADVFERFTALELSPEQDEAIAAIREAYAREQARRYQAWMRARRQLGAELSRAEPDSAAVSEAYQAAAEIEGKTLEARVRTYNRMRAELTVEQRKRLDAMGQGAW